MCFYKWLCLSLFEELVFIGARMCVSLKGAEGLGEAEQVTGTLACQPTAQCPRVPWASWWHTC